MKIAIVDFYKEVTGATHQVSTPVVRRALDRWQIPYATNTKPGATKQFWKVDIAHLGSAKTLHEIEIKEATERKNKAKPKADAVEQINPGYGLMERMSAVESIIGHLCKQMEEMNAFWKSK